MYIQLYFILLVYFVTIGINGQHDVCSCQFCHIINYKCYMFIKYKSPLKTSYKHNYTEARDLCHQLDAILFEPKDNETNYQVSKAASDHEWLAEEEYWIGINSIATGNSWIYDSDKSSITYNYWSSYGPDWDTGRQPNNDEQSCAAMYRGNDQNHDTYDRYAWYDTECSDKMEVVCEIAEHNYSTTSTTTSTTTTTTKTTTTSTTSTSPIPTSTTSTLTTSPNIIDKASSTPITLLASISVIFAVGLGMIFFMKYKQKFCFKKENLPLNTNGSISSNSSDDFEMEMMNLSSDVKIEKRQLSKGKLIGSGNFGNIHEGKMTEFKSPTFRKVALKYCKKNVSLNKFYKEVKITSHLNHENIVQFIGICLETQVIVMELMDGGQLLDFLRSEGPNLTNSDVIKMICDVVQGCAYLEQMKYIHRDLAARNCLLTSRSQLPRMVKISDFGMAKYLEKGNFYIGDGDQDMPIHWMSPESLNNYKYSTKSDVWSFGVVIWEILTLGERPFDGKSISEVMNLVCFERGHLDIPPDWLSTKLADILLQCWMYEPEERPSFDNLQTAITFLN